MKIFKIHKVIVLLVLLTAFIGCREEAEPVEKGMHFLYTCPTSEGIAKSIPADCRIEFWDFMNKFTYTGLESNFYTLKAPCNESVFSIKYINSVHDHNEPDYTFILRLNPFTKGEFFQPGTYKVKEFYIGYKNLTSGGQEYYPVKDVSVVWEEVALDGEIYSGKGKIIFPSDFPHSSFPGYYYPAQEIPFEFPARARSRH
ncbi:MAG TPA: hypothetical protein VFG54_19580 [Prolixibacteraceae bacterium]|nr:hypothetical protein [Prolixibacteraceae bacterium]